MVLVLGLTDLNFKGQKTHDSNFAVFPLAGFLAANQMTHKTFQDLCKDVSCHMDKAQMCSK